MNESKNELWWQDSSSGEEINSERIETERVEILKHFRKSYDLIRNLDYYDIYTDQVAYEAQAHTESLLAKLGLLTHEYIRQGEYSSVLDVGREVLEVLGIPGAEQASTQLASSAVVLSEAINLAAKTYTSGCYALKPAMIVATWKLGADFGIGDDNAYYLGTPTVGVCSFHDPEDEVGYLILEVLSEQIPIWESSWSGVPRQDDAYEILQDLNTGGNLVELYAEATSTEEMRNIRETYMRTNKATARTKIHELISNNLKRINS